MRAIFGFLALLIVLAAIGSISRRQLQVVGPAGAAAPAASLPVGTSSATVAQQARAMQERARAETVRALEQGAERNQRADP